MGSTTLPPLSHLADRAGELVALRDPVLEQVGEPAVALAEQRDRVLLVIVCRQHHDTRVRVSLADRVGAVDPLELEGGRHLDVGHDDVGAVLRRRREEGRRVLRDPHDLDVVVGVQQRPDALTHEDVVLPEHHSDRHATAPELCSSSRVPSAHAAAGGLRRG